MRALYGNESPEAMKRTHRIGSAGAPRRLAARQEICRSRRPRTASSAAASAFGLSYAT
jgi:hypothetical protein